MRALTLEKKEEEEVRAQTRAAWEIDPSKLLIKSFIGRDTFDTVHCDVYGGLDLAGSNQAGNNLTLKGWPLIADMVRFVNDATLHDNVESFSSQEEGDPRDSMGRGMDVVMITVRSDIGAFRTTVAFRCLSSRVA